MAAGSCTALEKISIDLLFIEEKLVEVWSLRLYAGYRLPSSGKEKNNLFQAEDAELPEARLREWERKALRLVVKGTYSRRLARAGPPTGRMATTVYHLLACTAVLAVLTLPVAFCTNPLSIERSCNLREERDTGYFVVNLKELLKDCRDLNGEELANVSVRPYLPDDPVASLFRLAYDGSLTTAGRIDRDSLCDSRGLCCEKDMRVRQNDQASVCDLRYDAAATTVVNRRFLALTLNIQLEDINDNKPMFQRARNGVRFKETDRLGASVPLPIAQDADWGRNGVVSYRLGSGAEQFELRQVRGDSRAAFPEAVRALELVNRAPLDRERRSSYGFQLLAEDGGRKVGATIINVTIEDVNDCTPEFVNGSRLAVNLEEDTRPHSTVFSVLAVDNDEGQNARVGYSLRPGHRRPYPVGLFGVDAYSGRVTLNGRLLYRRDEENVYELLVTAFDYGSPRRSSEIEVEVRVLDVNNHNPTVRVIGFGTQTSSVRVMENVAYASNVIATVLASDQDSGDNGRVECRLVNEPEGQQQQPASFRLQYMKEIGSSRAASYHLYAIRSFDRETQAVHIVRLRCSDHGSPPRHTNAIVRVLVDDANDSPPVWRKTEFSFSILENQQEGTAIGALQAEDADAPPNDAIQYKIEPETFKDVRIYLNTGRLVANKVFDREERDRYVFQVVAFNSAPPHYSATATVVLTILDVNDNSPEFDFATPRRVLVPEDSPRGTLVALLNVTDADEPGRREFNFILTSDDGSGGVGGSVPGRQHRNGANKFQIDSHGRLTLRDELDRELESEYHLRIGVSDGVHPARSNVFYLTVEIGDVNDTPPRFIFPDPERRVNRVNISSTLTPRSLVAKIDARDDDAGKNGNVTYRLLPTSTATGAGQSGPDDSEHFELEPVTGHLLVRENLRPFAGRLFMLRIEAADAGRDRQLKRDTLLQVAVKNDSFASSSSSSSSAAARPFPPSLSGGGGDRNGGGSGGHRNGGRVSSEVSGPALLLVSGLAILVLLILILSIAFLIVKRRAETASQARAVLDPSELMKMDPARAYESLTMKTQHHTGRSEQTGYPASSIPLALKKNYRQQQRQQQQHQQYEKCDDEPAAAAAAALNQQRMSRTSRTDLAKLGICGLDDLGMFHQRSSANSVPAPGRSSQCQSDTDLRLCGAGVAPDVALTAAASTTVRQQRGGVGGEYRCLVEGIICYQRRTPAAFVSLVALY
uniref:Protocadherin-like wing polarity protein stan n=1 Tax=Macrostomum lignano TaxID=282301 RepID=A0A1I8GZL4_9PLAT